MTDDGIAKLRKLLAAHAEKGSAAAPISKTGQGNAERQRRACADCLRNLVRPALDAFTTELKNAGHEAAARDNTERADAYPSVALSFTPRGGLASALLFKCDPKRGILVQRDVKASPTKRTITASTDRLGVIGTEAVTTQWVEQKILTFVEDVLKAN